MGHLICWRKIGKRRLIKYVDDTRRLVITEEFEQNTDCQHEGEQNDGCKKKTLKHKRYECLAILEIKNSENWCYRLNDK